jgi:transcriptional regulator with XRE-family HTH domain
MSLQIELVDALKRLLKAQGMTYAQLADRIGLSEAAVKRMLSQRRLNLDRLEQICAALDIGLTELAEEASRPRRTLSELDEVQEQALVDDPALLLALYLVLNRWTEDEARTRYRWTAAEWTHLLARLDRLGIIELLPGNRTRTRTARNFRWRRQGPMQHFFRKRLLPEFFAREFEGDRERLLLLSGMISPASEAQLRRRLEELAQEFDALQAQDSTLPASARVGISLVLAMRPWSLQLFDPMRRETPIQRTP